LTPPMPMHELVVPSGTTDIAIELHQADCDVATTPGDSSSLDCTQIQLAFPTPEAQWPKLEPEAKSVMMSSSSTRRKKQKWRSQTQQVAETGGFFQTLRSKATNFIDGPLEIIMGSVIILNVLSVYVELEYLGYQGGFSLGMVAGPVVDVTHAFQVIAHIFTVLYVVELFVKILILRGEMYFLDGGMRKFNIFDTFVVLVCVADMWIITPVVGGGNSSSSLMAVRLIRFFRVFRTLRIVRTFEIFAKLRVLVTTVVASFFALFWSLVLLTTVMLMAALVMCQGAATMLADPLLDSQMKTWAFVYFGTPSRSMWTVFEWTFGGGWQSYARKLIFEVSLWWAIFFVVYISGVIFAMTRIITALFLKDTLSVAALDAEAVIADKLKEKTRYAKKLHEFFESADASGDGFVTWEEFQEILKDDKVVTYLATLELDASQSQTLFNMLDDGDRKVAIDEFVKGALRLKGQARSADVIAVMHDCGRVLRKMDHVVDTLGAVHRKVHDERWV